MNIGQAAAASGVSAKMIRYYESIGLTPAASRKESGYRDYEAEDVYRLAFVRRARELGFSIEFIRDLLGLWSNRRRSNAEVRRIAAAHLTELEAQAMKLDAMIKTLKGLIHSCQHAGRQACPIMVELSGDK